jgi:hypothetical protein
LHQRLLREIEAGLGHFHLLGCGVEIKDRVFHFLLDARFEIVCVCLAFFEDRVGFSDVSLDLASLKDRDV